MVAFFIIIWLGGPIMIESIFLHVHKLQKNVYNWAQYFSIEIPIYNHSFLKMKFLLYFNKHFELKKKKIIYFYTILEIFYWISTFEWRKYADEVWHMQITLYFFSKFNPW